MTDDTRTQWNGPTRQLFGIPIAAATMTEVLASVAETIARGQRLRIGVVNAAKVVNMRRSQVLRDDVLSSDLILADGMSVVWASRILNRPLPERIAGIDLMLEILRLADARNYGVYCLGATDDVLSGVVDFIEREFPGVRLVGKRNGYFGSAEECQVAEAIRTAHPDVLFVAMTSPKKEKFLARWSPTMGVPVCHGVGGSFDVVAGKVKRAPTSWQRLGLEWFYRLKQEPGRLGRRYLVTNTIFCAMLIREALRLPAHLPAPPTK